MEFFFARRIRGGEPLPKGIPFCGEWLKWPPTTLTPLGSVHEVDEHGNDVRGDIRFVTQIRSDRLRFLERAFVEPSGEDQSERMVSGGCVRRRSRGCYRDLWQISQRVA
jgi:hypothetical protein